MCMFVDVFVGVFVSVFVCVGVSAIVVCLFFYTFKVIQLWKSHELEPELGSMIKKKVKKKTS